MLKSDEIRIRHMLDAVNEAIEFTEGSSRTTLDNNRMLVHTLVRLLEIIGEAAGGLSEGFHRAHPELPVREMTGMRNRLIHAYFDVDLDVVWQTVVHDLPGLKRTLDALMTSERSNGVLRR